MFEPDFLTEMYEASEALPGGGFRMGLFDKRVLLPIERLPECVLNETGEVLDPERIPGMVAAGWFEILSSEMTSTEAGFPFYIPGRLGLFLRLEREGVSSAELAAFATTEEDLIDIVLVNDEMPYEHDDDTVIILAAQRDELRAKTDERDRLVAAEAGHPEPWLRLTGPLATPEGLRSKIEELSADVARIERSIERMELNREFGVDFLPEKKQEWIRQLAFKLRWVHEYTRLSMVQKDRAQIAFGYSHFIFFRAHRHTGLALEDFEFSDLDWSLTLRNPWLAETDAEPALPIRLPGLIIRGESVTLTRRTTAAEYKRLAEKYELETYFRLLAQQQGQRICNHCLAALPEGSSEKRRYCSETCRNAAKAAAYRVRHPGWVKADRHDLPRDLFDLPDQPT